MPADKVFVTFLAVEVGFVITGTTMLIFALNTQASEARPFTVENVARDLLLQKCPIRAAIGNAILIFATFLLAIPGILMPTSRGWLKAHGAMVVVCGLFTLVIGLEIWFDTLKTRENLGTLWNRQSNDVQSLLQRELNCCGYLNSTSPPFIHDTTCLNPQIALAKGGCVRPFSSFGNNFLDVVFTGAFGMVGFDVIVMLMITIVLKDRKEKERYRHIDEKNGVGRF